MRRTLLPELLHDAPRQKRGRSVDAASKACDAALCRASKADQRKHDAYDDDEADEIDHIIHDWLLLSWTPGKETRVGARAAAAVNGA
jgi:hypothetical protein